MADVGKYTSRIDPAGGMSGEKMVSQRCSGGTKIPKNPKLAFLGVNQIPSFFGQSEIQHMDVSKYRGTPKTPQNDHF